VSHGLAPCSSYRRRPALVIATCSPDKPKFRKLCPKPRAGALHRHLYAVALAEIDNLALAPSP
jgi:hypothetical protein